MGLFNWKKSKPEAATAETKAAGAATGAAGEAAAAPAAETAGEGMARDPKKARRFFEHAKATADTRNYDYAIDLYIQGLRLDPQAVEQHVALREVAKRRKVTGGKPPGFGEKLKHGGGKTTLEKMLNAEFLWSMEPENSHYASLVMENAYKSELKEVTAWVGDFVIEANKASKKPSKDIYQKAQKIYMEVGAFDKAIEVCRLLLKLDPNNLQLHNALKNLEAERTMEAGQYGQGFQASVKGLEEQRALEEEGSMAKTETKLDAVIKRNKEAFEENISDLDLLVKYCNSLLETEREEDENLAYDIFIDGFERSGQYRFKMRAGDIRIKQFNRRKREIQTNIKQTPGDPSLQEALKALLTEQVKFELEEFTERVKNYPTNMGLKYELGRRQLALHDYDAAIASFQESQTDAKYRAMSLRFLGEAFYAKQWYDEAVNVFRKGIEAHPIGDDTLGLALRYELMASLQHKGERDEDLESAKEAYDLASGIAMINFNYLDIRQRVDTLNKLRDSLRKASS